MTGPDVQNVGEHALSEFQRPLMSPLLPEQESTTLEQQWQDVLAIMESQVRLTSSHQVPKLTSALKN